MQVGCKEKRGGVIIPSEWRRDKHEIGAGGY